MHGAVSLVNCLVGGHWYGHQVNLYTKEVCSVVDLEVVGRSIGKICVFSAILSSGCTELV